MPKAKSKPSGLSLSSDFKKQKSKLGKGKQQASNATDTSFKTRSIALPQQSVSKDKSAALVTRRNHTIDELIAQTRHYSSIARRDALQGLQELAIAHPALAIRHTGAIVTSAARLVGDDDAGVRKALRSFLVFLIDRMPKKLLAPYISTLLLYTTSAMSHIYPDIRLDAVRVADLCQAVFGSLVTQGWSKKLLENKRQDSTPRPEDLDTARTQGHGERLLDCYLNLLGASLPPPGQKMSQASAATASVISTDLSAGARLVILQSLTTFLRHTANSSSVRDSSASEQDMARCPTWFFESNFASKVEFKSFEEIFAHSDGVGYGDVLTADEIGEFASDTASTLGSAWTSKDSTASFTFALACMSGTQSDEMGDDVDGLAKQRQDVGVSARLLLFEILEPLLTAAFLDSAPAAFPPGAGLRSIQSTSGQLVCVVVDLALVLWRGVRSAEHAHPRKLGKLLSRLATYFPFGGQELESANLGRQSDAERLATRLNLAYCELVSLLGGISNTRTKELSSQLRAVNQYVITTLAPPSGTRSIVREQAFADILPSVWLLLDQTEIESDTLVKGLLTFWSNLAVTDPTKQTATELIGRLLLLPTFRSYSGRFAIREDSTSRPAIANWIITALPRYLWELGVRAPQASETALELLRLIACVNDTVVSREELKALQRPLATFFQVRHPQKGIIAGPYRRLPLGVQRRADGLVDYLAPLEPSLSGAALAAGAVSVEQI